MTSDEKKEKFIKIAEKRLEKAVHAIDVLKPLADRSRYEYTDTQVKYIVKALKDAVREVENTFKSGEGNKKRISIPKD